MASSMEEIPNKPIPKQRQINCVAIGDDGVGKSSLLQTHRFQEGFKDKVDNVSILMYRIYRIEVDPKVLPHARNY